MPVPPQLIELVDRFEANLQAYRSGHYKEAQLRQEFINPFFKALGWDVDNEQGYAEAYKDVVHEDAIKVGGVTKAPDYCFRIGGTRKFFVEAKKPSVHVKEDVSAAYQLRRYAWSAKLPLSILTDFEEFAVYDCRQKPSHADKASAGRIMLLGYGDFPNRWDDLSAIFSRQAILKGSFDKYAESNKGKRGTAEVDDAFLEEIESWREILAQNIYKRNPHLRTRELNAAVQATINRIVFLRICEARGIEPYSILLGITNGHHIYERLGDLFRGADERYNSGLFHFQQEKAIDEPPDEWTLKLAIDDKPLKDILTHLYYPESPYEFSVLPADILGQVYERFLGKVIRLTPRHQAVVEDKPEVKKAGGVFYTPTYIVDYIVKNTVGKLLEGKTPKQAAALKIADIACGSGSFLIGAYQYLLDWYRDAYVKEGPNKRKKELYQAASGYWRLAPAERKRILLAHIYGVDIDSQAVEVTKLSLLLKVLEGETGESLATQLSFFKERALPNLGNNIKCGNALIDSDFYQQHQLASFLDEDEARRINVFDWQAEFPEIFGRRNAGFDAIIGNPPYIRIQTLKEWAPLEVQHYKRAFKAASKGNYDIYTVFAERGLRLLNGNGVMGYILPHKFFNAQYGEPLRAVLSRGNHVSHIVHFGDEQVFSGATTYTCLLFLHKTGSEKCHFVKVDDLTEWRTAGKAVEGFLPATGIAAAEWNFSVGLDTGLFEKLGKMPVKLADVASRIGQGIRTSANEVFILDVLESDGDWVNAFSHRLGQAVRLERKAVVSFLLGKEIKAYRIRPSGKVALMPYTLDSRTATLISEHELLTRCPKAHRYLLDNKPFLELREKGRFRGSDWYCYGRNQNIDLMLRPKIVVPDIADRAAFALDETGDYAFTSGYGITLRETVAESPKYLLGLLNSRTLDFYLKKVSTPLRGGYFRYFTQFVQQLPIRPIDFTDDTDKARYDKMVAMVERMLSLQKQLAVAKTGHDRAVLERQISGVDKAIDALVYELYGLTEEEVQIVEDATSRRMATHKAASAGEAEVDAETLIPA